VYASASQINLQVPYGVSIGTNKAVTLTNGTAAPVTKTVTTALTAPGIFTLDGTGAGQAAALNSNGTVNSSQNAAKIGDSIILFVTGEGDYAAASITTRDGYLVPDTLTPLPQPSPLPVVTIGGTAASIISAQPVPGWMLGLLMIQATVPTGASTGAAVPVVVTVGGIDSQTNVTLSIKP
jgi:uncharacterized protein (TIGR03437 family)